MVNFSSSFFFYENQPVFSRTGHISENFSLKIHIKVSHASLPDSSFTETD